MLRTCRLILMSVFLVTFSVTGTTTFASATDASAAHIEATEAVDIGDARVDCVDKSEVEHHANDIHSCGSSSSFLDGRHGTFLRGADNEALQTGPDQILEGLFHDGLKRPPRRT